MDSDDAHDGHGDGPVPAGAPDPGFRSQVTAPRGDLVDARELARGLLGYRLDDPTLDATPLADVEYGPLIAYMHRRHGPPTESVYPGDKIHSGWVLTSPDPDVWLRVVPSLVGPGFCFAPLVVEPPRTGEGRCEISEERARAVAAAYRTALLDLLRPIRVRDAHVNARGVDMWDDGGFAQDEEGRLVHAVGHHPSCGYATPPGVFGTPEWVRLMLMLQELGGGVAADGMAPAIEILRDAVAKRGGDPDARDVRRPGPVNGMIGNTP